MLCIGRFAAQPNGLQDNPCGDHVHDAFSCVGKERDAAVMLKRAPGDGAATLHGTLSSKCNKCEVDSYQAATSHIGSAPRLAEMCPLSVPVFPSRHRAKNALLASNRYKLIGCLFWRHGVAICR